MFPTSEHVNDPKFEIVTRTSGCRMLSPVGQIEHVLLVVVVAREDAEEKEETPAADATRRRRDIVSTGDDS